MKIKDVKAIEKLLPKRDKKRRVDSGYELIRQGKNSMISYVRNTELPPCNDYVQVNVEKLAEKLYNIENPAKYLPRWVDFGNHSCIRESYIEKAKAIQESNLLEYKAVKK